MTRLPLVLPVLALTLGACSGGTSDAAGTGPAAPATVTVTTTATPSPSASGSSSPTASRTPSPAATGGVAEFVRVVRARVPDVAAGRSTAEITAIATTACRLLRGGAPAEEISGVTRSLGTADAEATDDATANELVKLAIDTTCPDQAGRVDEFQPLQP